MARAQTTRFEEMVLEVEFDPVGASGTYTPVAGLTDVTINRRSNTDTSEIPDVDDESLPLSLEREVRSQEVTVSGSGVTARQSRHELLDWHRSGARLNARLRNADVETNGAIGDIYEETGLAILTEFTETRTKGQKVSFTLAIEFDGVPAVTTKAA